MACWNRLLYCPLLVLIFANAYIDYANSETDNLEETMVLTSTAFEHNGEIPSLYTCDGRNISPPLAWDDVPEAAKSLVLIVYDPDAPDPKAPKMTWVHWVLYNIPPDLNNLQQAVKPGDLPHGTLEGLNDWKRTGYGGPCPPIGRHRYFHKLYALDEVLPDMGTPTKAKLEKAMAGHIIATLELVGTYERTK
jgi:Raf kinase inhibitor-like YbhB/YbcL family protein